MSQFFTIHPENPQARIINQVVESLKEGAVIAYPTDSAYALGCQIGNKEALSRIRNIRKLGKDHNFTLICKDFSEISKFAVINNSIYRLLKAYTPGPFTFILKASSEVPRRLQHPKRKSVGIRVPDNNIVRSILEALGESLMSVTLIMPNEKELLNDPNAIYDKLQNQVDIVIDGGSCGVEPTTVIDFLNEPFQIIRQGCGQINLA